MFCDILGFASFKAASLRSFETICFSGPAELATICATFSDFVSIYGASLT